MHQKKSTGSIHSIEEEFPDKNIVKIIISKKSKIKEMPNLLTLGNGKPPGVHQHDQALNKFLEDYIKNDGKNYKSIMDMLERSSPDVKGVKEGSNLIDEDKDLISQSFEIIKNLNNSYLTIQGPPGTGKTYSSANIIIELMKAGKKVGVTSNSHEAIKTLLKAIEQQAKDQDFEFCGMRKAKSSDKYDWKFIKDITVSKPLNMNDYSLYAGTSWFFVDPRMNKTLDYLFIDEAGQVALGTTIANATSAKNLVLIGDQMQLSQPMRAKHEGYAKMSSLDFVLEGNDTIPTDKGVFLNITRRLNNKICNYISSSFYDSRLTSDPIAETRSVNLKLDPIKDEGLFYVPIEHTGCSQRSDEEADLIENGKNKIIEYYNTQCDFILKDAQTLVNQSKYDEAIYKLSLVPDVCQECYYKCLDTLSSIYQQKIDNDCQQKMTQAKAAWAGKLNGEGAGEAADIIATINPQANCQNEIKALTTQINNKLSADAKARWDFKMKQYDDKIAQVKEETRIAEDKSIRDDDFREVEAQRDDQYRNKQADRNFELNKMKYTLIIGAGIHAQAQESSRNQPKSITYNKSLF